MGAANEYLGDRKSKHRGEEELDNARDINISHTGVKNLSGLP
jgi:hypothetical protein